MVKHGGNRKAIERSHGVESQLLVDFSANINPLGLSDHLKDLLLTNIDQLIHYPDSEYVELREAIASHHQLASDQVLAGNGEAELIYLLAASLKPRNVLLLAPTFSEYEEAFRISGSQFSYVDLKPETNFQVNSELLDTLENNLSIDCVCLCNPNNPTSQLISKPLLLEILVICEKRKIPLLLDEAFMDFIPNSHDYSLISEIRQNQQLVVLRSLTKFYAIPGLRLGYLLTSSQSVLKTMKEQQIPWSINTLAAIAGEHLFEDNDHIEKTHSLIKVQRDYLETALRELEGVVVFPSRSNYILFRITSGQPLQAQLIERQILIRSCANYRGLDDSYYRIAIKNFQENQQLIRELQELLTYE